MEWPRITLFGDSITRRSVDPNNGCWGSMIAYHFGEYFQTDVFGFEGYNTKWGLELMGKFFPKSYLNKVELFIPFFGHNDSWDKSFALHVPVEEYESNYRKMLKYLNENGVGNEKVILITPTWFHQESANKWAAKEMPEVQLIKDFEDAKRYRDVIMKLAGEFHIDVVDFFEDSANFEPLESMFCDGVHLNPLGAKMLYDKLEPLMERKIESAYQKPLGDLWHTPYVMQIPEVREQFEEKYKARLQQQQQPSASEKDS